MDENMNMQIILEAVDQSQEAFKDIDDALSGVQKLADDLSKAFDSFATTIGQVMGQATTDVESLTKPLEDISRSAEDATKPFEDVAHAANDASKAIEDITKSADDVTKAVDEISKTTIKLDVQQAEDALKSITKDAEDATKAITEMDKAQSQPHGSGGHGEGGLFGIQGQMDTMYAGMSLGAVAAPIDAGLGVSIDQFAQFDQAMRLVNQEMGLSQSGFQNLEQAVLSLSNSTGISAQDLSAGLYNVVASGVTNTSDALTMLQTAAEGAKAGNTDLNTATKALNAVMGAYGMNAKDAGNIMDVMFTAVNNGQMHFDDLAKSVGASATSAASAGVSYTELAAAQATLTNVGKNAESASQNLNSLIMGMIAPTSGATKEAKSLGIEWDAQALKAHGLSYMINEAIQATHGNSEELKKLVPNQRAYMAVLALGSNAHKQYTDTLNKMKDAHGATASALEEYDKGAGDAIEKMKTSIVNAGISLGATFAPAITKVTDAISKMAEWFSKLSPNTKEFLGIMLAVVGGILTLGAGFFMAISGIGAFVSGLKTLQEAMKAASIAEALMDALNPAGWIVLAIVAVAALAAALITYWGPIKDFISKLWSGIETETQKIWSGITSWFSSTLNSITQFFVKWGPNILSGLLGPFGQIALFFVQNWNQIKTGTTTIFNSIVTWLVNTWNTAVNSVKTVVGSIGTFFSNAWNGIVNIVQTVFATISSIFNQIAKTWSAPFQTWVFTLQQIWKGFSTIFQTGVSDLWNIVKTIFFTGILFIYDLVTGKWNEIGALFQRAFEMIQGYVQSFFTVVGAVFRNDFNNIANAVKVTWQTIVNLWNTSITAISQAVSKWWTSEEKAFSDGWQALMKGLAQWWTDTEKSWVDGFKNTAKAIEKWWTDTEKSFADGFKNVIQALAKWWVDYEKSWLDGWKQAGQDLEQAWLSIEKGVSDGVHNAYTALTTAWQDIKTWFENLPAQAMQWGEHMIDGFVQGIEGAINKVKSAVQNVIGAAKSFMGFNSPAKEGEGQHIVEWGANMIHGFIDGINSQIPNLRSVMNTVIAPPGNMTAMGQGMAMAGGSGYGNGAPVFHITVSGNITRNEQELAKIVSRELYKQAKSLGKF